jgi:hypothetical protein
MDKVIHNLTLDRLATYQITVPGLLDDRWSDWAEGIVIAVETEADGPPVTILTGTFDQAALQGLLRWLYALGLPLISAICIGLGSEVRQEPN